MTDSKPESVVDDTGGTKTLSLGNKTVRPHGTRMAMHYKHRLQRVLENPDIYDIEVGGGCAIVTANGRPSMDAIEISRIRESVDLQIYYIREDGIYINQRWSA